MAATAPAAVVGVPFSHNYGGSPGWTYSISPSAPPGLQLNSSGLLSGTPTQAGTFSFQINGSAPTVCTTDPVTGLTSCTAGESIQEVVLVVAAAPLTTTLTASPATETVTRQAQLSISGLQATLGTPTSGPLANATVIFTSKKSGQQLCTAVTNDNGLASCGTVLLSPSLATAKLAAELAVYGYTATYAGTSTTASSTASAKVVPRLP